MPKINKYSESNYVSVEGSLFNPGETSFTIDDTVPAGSTHTFSSNTPAESAGRVNSITKKPKKVKGKKPRKKAAANKPKKKKVP
jgi:hypothetical protein